MPYSGFAHNTYEMMNYQSIFRSFWMLFAILIPSILPAQYDDIYYNPDDDADYFSWHNGGTRHDPDQYYEESWRDNSGQISDRGIDDAGDFRTFNDRDYTYFDDYAYHYSSRIRRFHRPVYGAGFFDPFYTNMGFYDPFLMNPFGPNLSIYVGFNQFGGGMFSPWNRMNRWNRWNSWNQWDPFFGGGWNAMNPWGWNTMGGGFGNTFFVNNYFGNPWFGNPYFSNAMCPPTHWVNTGGFSGDVDTREVYYGPRSSRTGVAPHSGVVSRSGDGNTRDDLREARLREGRSASQSESGGDEPGRTLNWGDERPESRRADRIADETGRSSGSIRMSEVPRTGNNVRQQPATRQNPGTTTRPDSRYTRPSTRQSSATEPRATERPTRSRSVERPARRSQPSWESPTRSGSRSSGSSGSYQRSQSPSRSSGATPSRSSGSSRSSGASSTGKSSGGSSSVPSSGGSRSSSPRRGGGGE